jgi:signal transduction histidine kinase
MAEFGTNLSIFLIGQLADAFNEALSTLEAAETERARLYHEARESEQKYRAILNAMPDAIARMSRNGICLVFRASQGNTLAVDPGQMVGRSIQEFVVPELAQQTLACSERLVLLVNAILDAEKIEAAKLDFVLEPVELLPLIEQAIELNRPYSAQFGISFKLGQVAHDVWVEADGNRLIQVLSNLLSNAAKFSPPGDEIIITMERRGQAVRVGVTDHGSGVPESFRPRIFTKFAQADSSDARQRGGSGLGLCISRAIIEQFGGTIDYETGGTTGTTFYFELPEYHK